MAVNADLVILETTGSTNDDARELARDGAPHGGAVAAREQTQGRGRRGHVWSSPRGSLYLSIVLRPGVTMQHFVGIPAVCAMGVMDCLRNELGLAAAALKWPNDVIVGDRKIAGVLVEAGAGAGGPFAVCGVGLNIEPAPDEPEIPESPVALDRTYLSREIPSGDVLDFETLAHKLRDCIVARVDSWSADIVVGRAAAGPLAPVLDEYYDCCPLLGHQVNIVSPEGLPMGSGVFAGLDCWGRATVHFADGRDVDFSAEMASLRKA